jgi:Mor family transcriptional regulator
MVMASHGKRPEKAERNAEIARRVIAGEKIKTLAAEYGVSTARISQIATRLGHQPRRRGKPDQAAA